MSAEQGWFACYYHFNNTSRVSVFDLYAGEELLSSDVEPVYRRDMRFHPFRARDHGKKLYLFSSGVLHTLNLDSSITSWKGKRIRLDSTIGKADREMINDCEQHMMRRIPYGKAFKFLEGLTKDTLTRHWQDVFQGLEVCFLPSYLWYRRNWTRQSM